MSVPSEYFFPDRDSLFTALAKDCQDLLGEAITQDNTATILVSGGSTPMPLYQQLSEADLPWSKIHVALVDERWVNADQPGSNESFICNNLLQNKAAAAKFVAMKNTAETAALGQEHCEDCYQQLPQPFNVTILGMGADGHTASLFPAAKGLQQALDSGREELCSAIIAKPSEVTGELTERMSLTFNGLMQSRQIHLVITGDDKLSIYRQALDNFDNSLMPVSALLHQEEVPLLVYWAP